MIGNIFSFVAQEWHSATHNTYFQSIMLSIIAVEAIRCVSVIFVCFGAFKPNNQRYVRTDE